MRILILPSYLPAGTFFTRGRWNECAVFVGRWPPAEKRKLVERKTY